MSVRRMIAGSAVLVAAMAAVAAAALARLPADAQLPTHWDASGAGDRFADASTALFMPVLLAAGITAIMASLPRLEPLQERMAGSAPLYRTGWAAVLAMMALVEAIVAAPAFGIVLPATLPLVGAGLLFVAIGNMLPKSRPGFFVGIRTPWTLTDPDNWIATHRLGARTMVAGGLLIMVAAALPVSADVRAGIVMAAIAVAVVPPFVWSYLHWVRARRA